VVVERSPVRTGLSLQFSDLQGDFDKMQGEPIQFRLKVIVP
jgi:hypothetical protein